MCKADSQANTYDPSWVGHNLNVCLCVCVGGELGSNSHKENVIYQYGFGA